PRHPQQLAGFLTRQPTTFVLPKASSKRVTKTSHNIAVRRICCPPEQAANMADNSRATKGGQMTRYRQLAPHGLASAPLNLYLGCKGDLSWLRRSGWSLIYPRIW